VRTSDRLFTETPINISGTDPAGRPFEENTRALVLSRRGARIISRQALVPEQKLTIRCLKTGLEAAVQVVGPIMGEAEGCHFGVAFLQPEVNIWGIHFPLLDGTEKPAARLVLECLDCHAQEVVHLDVLELEVFLANQSLIRSCPNCKKPTLWTQFSSREESTPLERAAPSSGHTIQERKSPSREESVPLESAASPSGQTTQGRKSPRINLQVEVCLRHSDYGQEVVTSENISRGGFRIRSDKDYPLGTVVEAALPYSPGAPNIFTPARLVYKSEEAQRLEGSDPAPSAGKLPSPKRAT